MCLVDIILIAKLYRVEKEGGGEGKEGRESDLERERERERDRAKEKERKGRKGSTILDF